MLRIVSLSALLLLGCLGSAWAGCGDPVVPDPAALLGGQLLCASKDATGETYQEEHQLSGVLRERARGENHPIDPSYDAGTWAIQNGMVCYMYGGSGPFCFTVHDNVDDTYSFCEAGAPNATGRVLDLSENCTLQSISSNSSKLSLRAGPG